MNDASLRAGNDSDHEGGHDGGSVMAGKRTRTEGLQRKAEGSTPSPVNAPPKATHDDAPAPTMGQSYVDSIVHGAVDTKKVAEAEIAKGVHDENKITNAVFWACRPELVDKHLVAGSPDAKEWLRLRDEIVRPTLHAHETHHAAPKADAAPRGHEVDGGQLAKDGNAIAPRTEAVGPSGDELIDQLLAHVPPNGSSNKLEAQWMLKALGTKLFGASDATRGQLAQLARGETALRTKEGEPGAYQLKRGLAHLEKAGTHVEKIKSGEYVVEDGALPVLGAMIDLAAGRIREFVRGGMKKRRELFWFGDMVRADAGFANEKGGTKHTTGNAIDLGFGSGFGSDGDVVAALSGLDAGKISQVFPDGGADGIGAHVHLALGNDGRYELGLPFSSAFFPLSRHLGNAEKAAEKAAPPDPEVGTKIQASGLIMWHSIWYESTGVYQGGGKWKWSRSGKGRARDHLASAPMTALLARLDSGSPLKLSVAAAKEDGVDPKAADEKR